MRRRSMAKLPSTLSLMYSLGKVGEVVAVIYRLSIEVGV